MNAILFFAVLLSTTYLPPCKSVTFSFREPVYNFIENVGNAIIHVDKIDDCTDQAIILSVFGFLQGQLINQEVTFGPNDAEKAITFQITDDDIALEPTEMFELILYATDTNIRFKPNYKTTIYIMDDDELLIGLTQNVTVIEGRSATLCVSFNSIFESNFKIYVRYLYSNLPLYDPATPGEDFYLYTFSIEAISTVDGPDNNLCFNLYTSEDVFVEYDEYFMVGISFPYSVSNHLMVEISEGKDTAAVCIKDNDRVMIGFERRRDYVSEDITNGVKLICVRVLKGRLRREASFIVQYYDTSIHSDYMAVANEDFKKEVIIFTLSQYATQVCFNVAIIDDNIHERYENIYAYISTSDPQVTISRRWTTLTIKDDDKLIIGLAQNVTAMEGNNASLCVNFSSIFASNFKINVRHLLSDITLDDPATPGKDFDLPNFSIEVISTIHGPDNNLCFNIFVMEDEFVEYVECFEVDISLQYSVRGREIAEGKDTASVCIEDNDRVVIGFEETEVLVPEDIINGVKLLCVKVLEGELMREATVMVQYYDQTTVADEMIFLIFSQNDTRVCFNVSIIDDNIHEQDEVFFVKITTSDPQVILSPRQTNLTINDNDELLIGLTQNVTVMEGNNATLCVNFSSEFGTNFNIHVRHLNNPKVDNLATPGEDFYPPNFYIEAISTLYDPDNSLCFDIFVMEDEFVENDECFEVGIILPESVSGRDIAEGLDTAVVCIKDNNSVVIGFEETEVQVPENITDGVKLLCVKVLEGELMRETIVTIKYCDHTAVADKDYKEEMIFLAFSQDDTRVCFNVSIIDDNIHEQDKVFFAKINTSDSQVILSPHFTNITIESDDVLTVEFTGEPYKVREGDFFVFITVGLSMSTQPENEILVKLITKDISGISNAAKVGDDYKYLSTDLPLFNGYITIVIELINDNSVEDDEDFKVELQIMNLEKNVKLSKDNAIVTIVDDDSNNSG